jgi:hypothetical protein
VANQLSFFRKQAIGGHYHTARPRRATCRIGAESLPYRQRRLSAFPGVRAALPYAMPFL